MKRAIIFGGGGQDGFYLTQLLKRKGVEVHAFGHQQCDVGVQGYVFHEVARILPDYIFHFAAKSKTGYEHNRANHRAIIDGTAHILEAVKAYRPDCRVFITGSILQFDGPIVSLSSRPLYDSIYAAQRHASVALAKYYRKQGMKVYVGYLSHHDSPRRTGEFLAKKLAMESLCVTSTRPVCVDPYDFKEWNFAGDMMEAVWQQVNSDTYEAVLGSGNGESVIGFLGLCMEIAGTSKLEPKLIHSTKPGSMFITASPEFSRCFRTSIRELARMMVEDAVQCRLPPRPERTCSSTLCPDPAPPPPAPHSNTVRD